jgi:hypothetical protein
LNEIGITSYDNNEDALEALMDKIDSLPEQKIVNLLLNFLNGPALMDLLEQIIQERMDSGQLTISTSQDIDEFIKDMTN